ncbi:MAG TPA: mechanosensitive ion channel domain-containing protein [Anaerolineales bacterium]|nr:mechanosensitive ion channel domain-containing protein [Anaerolineales bacterium]
MNFGSSIDWQSFLITAALHVAGAIAILLVGRWLAGLLQRSLRVLLRRTNATPALTEIVTRGTYYGILLLFLCLALIALGLPSNVVLGAVGIVIVVAAVALRESLRDLAATVNFVIFQPFKVGDIVETNGVTGEVRELLLLSTVLVTGDNRQIVIPNGNIQNNNLINLSVFQEVRLDLPVPLGYADELKHARESLLEIAKEDDRVLHSPAPVVHLMKFGESQVEYVLRVYAKPADVWELRPALNERIKAQLEQRHLTIPVPQLQVHAGTGLLADPDSAPARDEAG